MSASLDLGHALELVANLRRVRDEQDSGSSMRCIELTGQLAALVPQLIVDLKALRASNQAMRKALTRITYGPCRVKALVEPCPEKAECAPCIARAALAQEGGEHERS